MVEGVGCADGSGGGDVDSMASIVEESGANVKSAEAREGTRKGGFWGGGGRRKVGQEGGGDGL
jgi:hypothetical protein